MPPLLCASPNILDQSFPRNDYELDLVVDALGKIEELIQNDEVHLILTDVLHDLLLSFDWDTRIGQYGILLDIDRLLRQWFLQPHERLIKICISNIDLYTPHPLPQSAEKQNGLVEFWSDEMGKLLVLHDCCCPNNQFFIGIACESAFAGGEIGKYDNPNNQRVFPLVGPDDINRLLIDAYERVIPAGSYQKSVSLDEARRNLSCIGGTLDRVDGDHFIYVFEGSRAWPLTLRDPVPDAHLGQLVQITGFSLPIIKYALINGRLPPSVLRLDRVIK